MEELSSYFEEETGAQAKSARPEFRVMQAQLDKQGNKKLVEVGAAWRNTSRSGKTFYSLKIGALRLLMFPA